MPARPSLVRYPAHIDISYIIRYMCMHTDNTVKTNKDKIQPSSSNSNTGVPIKWSSGVIKLMELHASAMFILDRAAYDICVGLCFDDQQ